MASFKGRLAIITISKLKEQLANRKKMDITRLHGLDILVKYVFELSSGEHVLTTEKRFHQHTVTFICV